MRLTKKQRIVVAVGVFAMLSVCAYPPVSYQYTLPGQIYWTGPWDDARQQQKPATYVIEYRRLWIWNARGNSIRSSALLLQVGVIAVLTTGACVLAAPPRE